MSNLFVEIIDSLGLHNDESIKRLKEVLDPLEGVVPYRNIKVSCIHDKFIELDSLTPSEPDTLTIIVWAYFNYRELGNVYSGTLYGMNDFIHEDFNPHSGDEGAVLIKAPEGAVVAEYHKDKETLIILFDAVHYDGNIGADSFTILQNLMDDFIRLVLDGVSAEEINEKRKQAMEEKKRALIEERVKARIEEQVWARKARLDSMQIEVASTRTSYIDKLNKLSALMLEYEAAVNSSSKAVTKVLADLRKVKELPCIVDYDFDGREFKIVTDTLYCYDTEGNKYLVGRYECYVDFRDSRVLFFNLDEENKRKSYWGADCHHPHVSYDGEPCLGNSAPMICELVKDYEFTALVTVLKAFLEQANLEDPAGKYVKYWDRVAEDGTIIPAEPEEVTCAACGECISADEGYYDCQDCGDRICENCAHYVEGYGDVCPSCIDNYTWVDRLGRYVYNDYLYYCEHCNKIVVDKIVANDDEYEDIHDVIVCNSCRDELYDTCSGCGDVYKKDDMLTCKNCGEYVCEYCKVTTELGHVFCNDDCLHEYDEDNDEDNDEEVEPDSVPSLEVATCNTCGLNISGDNMRYTCEKCYASGCPSCIQFVDGAWRCPSCRGGNE